MVAAVDQAHPAAIAVIALPALVCVTITASLVNAMWPVTLTRSALRIPLSGFGRVVIPLSDVAGVGLLYRVHRGPDRSPSGWYAYVWRRNGSVQA
jgi:hypothetical protein